MRTHLLALLLLASPLVGCLAPAAPPPQEPEALAWSMELPLTMHVVLVGFDGRLDPAKLLPLLPETRPVHEGSTLGTQRKLALEPVQYRLTWRFHEAPEAFERAFFEAAKAASFEGPAPQFLVNYDQNRSAPLFDAPLLPPVLGGMLNPKPAMDYIDAPTLEDWIAANRGAHGLDFGGAGYTFFLVDSHTSQGLPQDRYHYYYFDDGTIDADLHQERPTVPMSKLKAVEFHTPKDPTSNRGWGGKFDFAWIDVGAAPSWLDYEPWNPPFEDDNVDHPVWDLQGQDDKLHRNLARHLSDAAVVKIVRSTSYPVTWTPKWVIPVHVFIEPSVSHELNPAGGVDVRAWLQPERIVAAYKDLAPWVETEVTVQTYELPQDDPGMAEAVRRAKAYGDVTVVSSGVIEDHVRTHWAQYVPDVPGALVWPQFLFYFSGTYTFWGPNQGGGYAAGDAWGKSWAAFDHIFDVCTDLARTPCTRGTRWEGAGTMDMLVIHEAGHHVGFNHARSTSLLNEARDDDTYLENWFWDSVWSVMTYRHQNPGFDRYDKDTLARGHTGDLLNLAAERLQVLGSAHPEAQAQTRQGIAAAEQLLRQGQWQEAAWQALRTWRALEPFEPLTPAAAEPEPQVKRFGDVALVPVSPSLPAGAPVELPDTSDLRAYALQFEVREDAAHIYIAFRDTRPDLGTLRAAQLFLTGPDGEFAGGVFNQVFADAYITRTRGPGTYTATLLTDGGLANEFEVTVDVAYPGY